MIISLNAMQSLNDAEKAKLSNFSKDYIEIFKSQLRQRIDEDYTPNQVSLSIHIIQEHSNVLKQIKEDLKTDPDLLQKETEKLLAEVQRLNSEQNKRANEKGYLKAAVEMTIDKNYLAEIGLLTKSQKKNFKKKNNRKKHNDQHVQEIGIAQEEFKEDLIKEQKLLELDKIIVPALLDLLGRNGLFGKQWNYNFLDEMSKHNIIDYYFLQLEFRYKFEGEDGFFEKIELPIIKSYNKELVDRYIPSFFRDITNLIKRLAICQLIDGNSIHSSSFFYFRFRKILLEVATTIKVKLDLEKEITEIERKQLDEINATLLFRMVTEVEWKPESKYLKGAINDLLEKDLIDKILLEKVDRSELRDESTSFPKLKKSLYSRVNLLDIDDIYDGLEWSEEKDKKHLRELMSRNTK